MKFSYSLTVLFILRCFETFLNFFVDCLNFFSTRALALSKFLCLGCFFKSVLMILSATAKLPKLNERCIKHLFA